ncbi:hypothetical protein A0J61_09570 [Choanephora cucurbitarum]|uniref:Uncharacterized protein n=1 Tax=Choanephora cucurbitarum TaxID=101091 RepID=A0A1C7N058_9FUNG|nr:hypothetical protein A0J61_09570 [Choanephora cucurbitarum]
MAYTSVGKALTELCVIDENNEMLSYREQFCAENNNIVDHYREFFSYQCYKDFLLRGVIDGSAICLVIFVDDYQLKACRRLTKLTFVEYKTKDENMIQIAVCSGKPKNIVSFLEPLVNEVKQMHEKGLAIKEEGNEIFRGRVAILRFTGDIPGTTELMCFVGHGKYFPEKGDDRTIEELKNGDAVMEKFKDHELTDYSFAFSVPSTQRSFIDRLDAQIVESNPICPAAFNYSFDNHTGCDRAVDLQQLLLTSRLDGLVNVVSLTLQKSVSAKDVADMRRFLDLWERFLKNEISQRRLNLRA